MLVSTQLSIAATLTVRPVVKGTAAVKVVVGRVVPKRLANMLPATIIEL